MEYRKTITLKDGRECVLRSTVDRDARAVAAAFLLHFSVISGYKPRLSHCVRCGRRMEDREIRWLDPDSGGLVCPGCAESLSGLRAVTAAQAQWMRDVLEKGIDKTDRPDADAPGPLLGLYVESRMEKPIRHKGLWK